MEVECGALADPKPFVWQTDTAIAKNSWCYTDTLEYKTSRQIICNFIEIISKNGNMLLNVGPKGDGEIPEEDQNMLLGSGLTAGLSQKGLCRCHLPEHILACLRKMEAVRSKSFK